MSIPAAEYDYLTRTVTPIELTPGESLTGRNIVFADPVLASKARETHRDWYDLLSARIKSRNL